MFHPHPSRALREAFARKPYQGQSPEAARHVFVALNVVRLQARSETVGDGADLKEVYDTERHVLYAACTRAEGDGSRARCYVTASR